jgi:hypothetical protein
MINGVLPGVLPFSITGKKFFLLLMNEMVKKPEPKMILLPEPHTRERCSQTSSSGSNNKKVL